MKNLSLFFAVLSSAVCFLLGVSLGTSLSLVLVRSSPSSSRDESECTCAICLPDHYCKKCGHVSRDCPRLQWYFKRITNVVEKAVK